METKKNHIDFKLQDSNDSNYSNLLTTKKQLVDIEASIDFILEDAKNYILVISKDGMIEKASASFVQLLGYSLDELTKISVKRLLVRGSFISSFNVANYYFENILLGKTSLIKKIKWRFIPSDKEEDSLLFVGWEIV